MARIVEAGKALQQAIQQYRMLESTYNTLAHATDVGGRGQCPGRCDADLHAGGEGAVRPAVGRRQPLRRGERPADLGPLRRCRPDRRPSRRRCSAASWRPPTSGRSARPGWNPPQGSILGLTSLLDRITGSRDVTEVSAVNGALAVEQQNIEHHKAQIAQVQLMLATEDRIERQRAEQQRWESANTLVRKHRAP